MSASEKTQTTVEHEADAAEGIVLLGAEMLTWSDLDGELGPFRGRLATHLVAGFDGAPGRVLIAGPHSAAVIAQVAAPFDAVDVLVRSWPDAQTLRAELPESIRVLCGPLDRMPRPEPGYDVVVAAAGLDRLHSEEDEAPGWREVLDQLGELLSGRGELFLGVHNDVGIERLLAPVQRAGDRDADWPTGTWRAEAEPASAAEVVAHLSAAGLARVESWACHGPGAEPCLAAGWDTFTELAADPLLHRLVAESYRHHDSAAAPLLKDPSMVAIDLVRAGLGAATAPLAIVHLRRGADAHDAAPSRVVFWLERADEESAEAVLRLERTATGWERSVLVAPQRPQQLGPALHRDLTKLAGAVPAALSVADVLRGCCAVNDMALAGQWVRRYRGWLDPSGSGTVRAERVATALADLAADDGGLVALDASLVANEEAATEVVCYLALLGFASDLLGRGLRHPWEASVSPVEAAAALAAAADYEVGSATVAAAIDLDERLRPDAGQVRDFRRAASGAVPPTYAELAVLVESLERRATEADEHINWLLRNIQRRQRLVRQTRGQLERVERSPEMRVGRRVLSVRDKRRQRRASERSDNVGVWQAPAQKQRLAKRLVERHRVRKTGLTPAERPAELEDSLIPPGHATDPRRFTVVAGLGNDPVRHSRLRRARFRVERWIGLR